MGQVLTQSVEQQHNFLDSCKHQKDAVQKLGGFVVSPKDHKEDFVEQSFEVFQDHSQTFSSSYQESSLSSIYSINTETSHELTEQDAQLINSLNTTDRVLYNKGYLKLKEIHSRAHQAESDQEISLESSIDVSTSKTHSQFEHSSESTGSAEHIKSSTASQASTLIHSTSDLEASHNSIGRARDLESSTTSRASLSSISSDSSTSSRLSKISNAFRQFWGMITKNYKKEEQVMPVSSKGNLQQKLDEKIASALQASSTARMSESAANKLLAQAIIKNDLSNFKKAINNGAKLQLLERTLNDSEELTDIAESDTNVGLLLRRGRTLAEALSESGKSEFLECLAHPDVRISRDQMDYNHGRPSTLKNNLNDYGLNHVVKRLIYDGLLN